jgi:hypothetical protein
MKVRKIKMTKIFGIYFTKNHTTQEALGCMSELTDLGYAEFDAGGGNDFAESGVYAEWSAALPLADMLEVLKEEANGFKDEDIGHYLLAVEEALSVEFSSSLAKRLRDPEDGEMDFYAPPEHWADLSEWVPLSQFLDRLVIIAQLGRGAGTYPDEDQFGFDESEYDNDHLTEVGNL